VPINAARMTPNAISIPSELEVATARVEIVDWVAIIVRFLHSRQSPDRSGDLDEGVVRVAFLLFVVIFVLFFL